MGLSLQEREDHTHTRTHTHIYIYIYILHLSFIRIFILKKKEKRKKRTVCNFHLSFYRLPNKQTNDRIYSSSLHHKQNFPRKKEKEKVNNGLGDVEKWKP